MRRTRILFSVLFAFLTSLAPTRAVDDVVISEFMAANNGPLADEDRDFSDWIELQNIGTNTVNLDGWYLTDRTNDLKQWRFPSTNLPPNAFLIVFASNKDRRVPGAPLHTNFRLANEGEYLGLVRPDGVTVASAYVPFYPVQIGGASFGLPLRQTESILVASGAVARVLVPTDGSLGSAWNGLMFNDSGWPALRTGIGFEADPGGPFVPTQIANSVAEFGGTHGLNSWSYGYWSQKTDADGQYAASEFVPFPNSGGNFGPNNYWTGSSWDWFNGDPPFTEITSQGGTPTADNGIPALPTHWAIRRYINEHNGPLTISGRVTHTSDWVFVTATGISASSLLYIYLTDIGEGYIDDVRLVQGTVPASGVNLLANGDFESPNLNPWTVSANLVESAPTTAFRKSGSRSLRIVANGGGSSQSTAIWQSISPALVSGQIYTLSYWYLPAVTNSAPLVVRFSGSWIETTPVFCGDGTIARIFVDGQEVFSKPAFVSSSDYSITVPATLGSRVDFALDPGASADDNCDDTIFTANISSADPNIALVANSVADWSTLGKQGDKNWYYGYWNAGPAIPLPPYTAANFTPFPRSGGPFGSANFWNGREWDWWNGDPPIDEIGERLMMANGLNNTNIHWVIRRWLSEVSGSVIVDWSITKLEASGAGVTARVFHNGIQRDFVTLPGTNAPVVQRSVIINNVQVGDPIDIVLDPTGIGGGYGDGGDPSFVTAVIRGSPSLTRQIFSTIQGSMQNVGSSAYIRIPFTVTDPASIQFLALRMKYDDGFTAWINGVPVASANSPADPQWDTTASGTRSDADANDYVEFNITPSRGALQMGNNVLAIQGLNASVTDSDFLVLPELVASRLELATNTGRYFSVQTPGTANGYGQTNLGPIISTASHSPNVPTDNQDLRVTASLISTFRPIGSVRLYYRTMFSNEVETAMFDDGQHQDGLAGDGTFGGTIPASAANPGQMVRYYVYATDIQGNASRFPAFDDPLNSPQYQGTVVANPVLTNQIPVFHMFVQDPVMATNYIGTRGSFFYEGVFYDNVAINLHGQTTAFVFGKRSMDFDMNRGYTFRWKEGQPTVNDFVLLTPIADKAYVRQIMAYETFAKAGVPTHFAYFVRVEQNGQFFGIFDLVEKGDDNFLARNGLDPEGALYKVYLPLTNAYGGVVEKKTRQFEPNDDLNDLINGVNLTGQPLRRYVCDNIDIPEVINFLATIQFVQNEDCCWFKNYYLYRDTHGSGEWQMFPWDLDLTFGRTFGFFVLNGQVINGYFNTNIFWTNAYYTQARSLYDYIGVSQPIVNSIFLIPETYEMFFRRWTTVHLDFLRTNNSHPLLLGLERRTDELVNQIRPDAALDFAKWGNWFPTQTLDVAVQVLKTEYFARRRNWIFNTLAFANDGPYLGPQPTNVVVRFGAIEYNPAGGQAQEYIQITNANLIAVDISGWKVSGGIDYTFRHGTVIPARNAIYITPSLNAFRARTTGARGSLGLFVQGNYNGQLSAWGEPLQITDPTGRIVTSTNIPSTPSALQRYLRITEIMYNPSALAGNPTDPQEFEYIELKNTGPIPLNLVGVSFSNGIEFQFPSGGPVTSLAAGQSVLVVRNLAAFTTRYGGGLNVGGQFIGALDNAGEVLRLDDATGEKILEFAYDNSWQPITDGFGFSLVAVNETTPWENWGLPANWAASGQLNGSPGQSNSPGPTLAPIKINEVLSASTPPAVDAIELFNPTGSPVNIGGWFLSDDFRTPRKYRFPDNTIIPAQGYLTRTEAQFNPNPSLPTSFAFSSSGDEVHLFSADAAGNLTGYEHGFAFGAAEPGVTLGRHVISTGEEHFVAQEANTIGAANGPPRVGPLAITEIYFHPVSLTGEGDNSDDEFVEIRNLSGSNVPLYDPAIPANRWFLSGGVSLTFPPNFSLASGGTVLAVNFNPTNAAKLAAFRSRVSVSVGTSIVGPFDGKLDNSSDTVALFKPGTPVLGVTPYVQMDRVDYSDEAPWPNTADGTGTSIQRKLLTAYGNDPANWAAGRPTAGQGYPNGTLPTITQQPFNVLTGATMNAMFTVGAAGGFPLNYQWYFGDESIPGGTNSNLILPNVQFDQQGSYHVVVFNGSGAAVSSNATLTLILPPYFVANPSNVLVRVRPDPQAAPTTNATFSFDARGFGTLSYQWLFKGQPIPGATGPTLTIFNVQVANGGEYSVAVTDNIGTIFSTPANLYPLVTPTIVQQPVGQTVAAGANVILSVAVNGSPAPFTYEWRRGSVTQVALVSNSTNGFYNFTAPVTNGGNLYRVVVKNLANLTGVASSVVIVTTVSDTDNDGLPDDWENQFGLDPGSSSDRLLDLDGDGVSNKDEYEAGTNPANASSYLKIDSISAAGTAVIRFGAVAGHTYTIQYRTDLENSAWTKLTDIPGRAANGTEQITDALFGSGRYYRVVTPQQP